MNASGRVAFLGTPVGGQQGVYTAIGGETVLADYVLIAAPGGSIVDVPSNLVGGPNQPDMNASGVVAFYATLASGLAVMKGDGGAPVTVAPVDGIDIALLRPPGLAIDDSGAVAFPYYRPVGDDDFVESGIAIGPGLGTTVDSASEPYVPLTYCQSNPCYRYSAPVFDESRGAIVYRRVRLGPAGPFLNGPVSDQVRSGDGGATTLIDEATWIASDFFETIQAFDVNSGGLTVIARTTDTGYIPGQGDPVLEPGIWAHDGDTLVRRPEFTAPVPPAAIAINRDGEIAVNHTSSALGMVRGLYVGGDADANRIVAVGDVLLGRSILDISFHRGLSDEGEVAFGLGLGNGMTAIFRAEPVVPEITRPAAGTVLPGDPVRFAWVSNGVAVSEWHLTAGVSPGDSAYFSSGPLPPEARFVVAGGLPTGGQTVHVRLAYVAEGEAVHVDYEFQAGQAPAGPGTPALNYRGVNSNRVVLDGPVTRLLSHADYDGDGLQDLLLWRAPRAGPGGLASRLFVLTGAGDGTFLDATDDLVDVAVPPEFPLAVSVDFNGDGRDDVAIFGGGADAVPQLLLGNPDGRLHHSTALGQAVLDFANNPDGDPTAVGLLAVGAGAGDVDGDGDIDLCVVGPTWPLTRPRLLINDGAAGFTLERTRIPDDLPRSPSEVVWACALADLDDDGDLDLVLGGSAKTLPAGEGTPSMLLLNDGTGHFLSAPVLFPYPDFNHGNTAVSSIAIGDVNGDGLPDVALAHAREETGDPENPVASGRYIQILANDGFGHFIEATGAWMGDQSATEVTILNRASRLEIVDLEGDGDFDLVAGDAAPFASDPRGPLVYRNDGNSLQAIDATSVTPDGFEGRYVMVMDANGDGRADLVAPHVDDWLIGVQFDERTRIETSLYTAEPPPGPALVKPGTDAPMAGPDQEFAWVASGLEVDTWRLTVGTTPGGTSHADSGTLGAGARRFEVHGLPSAGPPVHARLHFTVDDEERFEDYALTPGPAGDPDPDPVGHQYVTVQSDATVLVRQVLTALARGDFDGDGNLDLFMVRPLSPGFADLPRAWHLLLGNGDGTFVEATSDVVDASPRIEDMVGVAADFNGDDRLDIAIFERDGAALPQLLLSAPDGRLHESDFHADPADLAALGEAAGQLRVTGISAGDIDGDGDVDLFLEAGGSGPLYLSRPFLNDGTGHFTLEMARTDNERLFGPANAWRYDQNLLVDLDADGDLDLVMGARIVAGDADVGAASKVLLNNGAGYFRGVPHDLPRPDFNDGLTRVTGIAAGDLNRDGLPDLALAHTREDSGDPDRPPFTGRHVQILINDGAGHFHDESAEWMGDQGATEVVTDPDSGESNFNSTPDLALTDVDHDGDVDLTAGHSDPPFLYLNDGAGRLAPLQFSSVNPGGAFEGRNAFPADVNGDGYPDFVAPLIDYGLTPATDDDYTRIEVAMFNALPGNGSSLQVVTPFVRLSEGYDTVSVPVMRWGNLAGPVSIEYFAEEIVPVGDEDISAIRATAGEDFTGVSGTLVWPDGSDDPKTITVPLLRDKIAEMDERFSIALRNPLGNAVLGFHVGAIVEIVDNDAPTDVDGDGVLDRDDNCPTHANPDQANRDGDVLGDACDSDRDGDGMPNHYEQDLGFDPDDAGDGPLDFDGDGFSNAREFEGGSDPLDRSSLPRPPIVAPLRYEYTTVTTSQPQFPGDVTTHIARGDLDGDGDEDLLVGTVNNDTIDPAPLPIYLLESAGNGHLLDRTAASLPANFRARRPVGLLADFNRDGRLDAAVFDAGEWDPEIGDDVGGVPQLLLARPGGGFDLSSGFADALAAIRGSSENRVYAKDSSAGDVHGDGLVDLYLEIGGGRPFVPGVNSGVLFANENGLGQFTIETDRVSPEVLAESIGGGAVRWGGNEFADVDGDGDLDLVLATNNAIPPQPSHLLLNDGFGNFPAATAVHLPGSEWRGGGGRWRALAVAAGDLDGDGLPDLVFSLMYHGEGLGRDDPEAPSATGRHLQILINDGPNGFLDETAARLPDQSLEDAVHGATHGDLNYNTSSDVKVADFDGDGDQDILVGSVGQHMLPEAPPVYVNDGGGHFTALDTTLVNHGSTTFGANAVALDLDADGDLDFVHLERISPTITRVVASLLTVIRPGDRDGDRMPDDWEVDHGLDPDDPTDALQDPDRDGLYNVEEFVTGTDPTLRDTDGDGVLDGTPFGRIAGRRPLSPEERINAILPILNFLIE